jgi:hypothetical protein
MRSLIGGIVLAIVVGLVAVSTVGATGHFYSDVSGGSFVGVSRTPHSFTFQLIGGTATYTITCQNTTYDGVKPASGTATEFAFNFHPSNCAAVSGSVTLAVDQPWCRNAWRVKMSDPFPSTSTAAMEAWTSCDNLTFHLPVDDCDITYPRVTGLLDGVTVVDRNAADSADATPSNARGMRLGWGGPLSYTSTCWFVLASGTGYHTGVGWIPGVWGGP